MAAVLPKSWRQVTDLLLAGMRALWEEMNSPGSDNEISARAMRDRLRRAVSELASAELEAALETVGYELAAVHANLHDEERRLLAAGLRLMTDRHLVDFAVLSLALAVDHALLHRLFMPTQQAVTATQGLTVQARSGDSDDAKLAAYLSGQPAKLSSGDLVAGYVLAVRLPAHSDSTRCLRSMMEAWSGKDKLLLDRNPGAIGKREQALRKVVSLRNRCVHKKAPITPDDAESVWRVVVADTEHAFMRYFAGASGRVSGES